MYVIGEELLLLFLLGLLLVWQSGFLNLGWFHICSHMSELLLLVFSTLRVLTRNTQTDSAKALPECKQNVSGTIAAAEVVYL